MKSFHPDSLPDLTGRVYLVTGGNTGIGYWTVYHLAKHHAKVYLGARNSTKGETAISKIKETLPEAEVHLLLMDLANLTSVVEAAKTFLKSEIKLHGLINSAGIMATPYEVTTDGYEAQFQTNYISHWLLTYHLLPLLRQTSSTSPPSSVRIVNVTSNGHAFAPPSGIQFSDVSLTSSSGMRRYGQSKLANILHAKELDRRYHATDGITTAAVHPGSVETQLNLNVSMKGSKLIYNTLHLFGVYVSPEQGSFGSLFAVASDGMVKMGSGVYLTPTAKKSKPSKLAENVALGKELWEWTEKEMKRLGQI